MSNLAGKRILITGGLGFIGSNLAQACYQQDGKVTILDNFGSSSGANLYNINAIRSRIRLVGGDIRDSRATRESVRGADIIFHCAARISHANSMLEPRLDAQVNCKGTLNVLEAVRIENPRAKVVFVGTSTQVGVMKGEIIDETHPEFPLDIYSAHKSTGEKYTLLYHTAYGLPTVAVRLVNTYGPRALIASSYSSFINYFIGLALQGEAIPIYGSGQQLRSAIYIDDAVEALIRAAGNKKSEGEVYFASSDRSYGVLEIAETIAQVIGGRIVKQPWPKDRRAIEPGDAVISHQKITRELGWRPTVDLAKGLYLTEKYYRRCLDQYLPAEQILVRQERERTLMKKYHWRQA